MRVSQHAIQRFLERVMNIKDFTDDDFTKTKKYLSRVFENIIPGSYSRPFSLPECKNFKVIHRNNVVITIIQK